MAILKTCLFPGCGELVPRGYCDKHKNRERYCCFPGCGVKVLGTSYCSQHLPELLSDARRGSSNDRGYDSAWRKVSKQYLKLHPLCEDCEIIGLVAPAVLVHHIKPLREGGAKLNYSNLRALCQHCHETAHKRLRSRFR